MSPRTLLTIVLACAAGLFLGCGAKVTLVSSENEPVPNAVEPMETLRAGARFDPSARHFLQWTGSEIVCNATGIHEHHVNDFTRRPGTGFGRFGEAESWPSLDTSWIELVPVSPGERNLGALQKGDEEIADTTYDQATETITLSSGTRLERRERVWLLRDWQLVSVNAATGPAAYLNSPENLKELMKARPSGEYAEKRPLDAFEKEALERLRAGDEVALRQSDRDLRMLGAIHAHQGCLSCHKVKEGALLGAFSYTLKLQSEETQAAHKLKSLAGLTEQQRWAVRAIEAIGGKVIRAPDGPVTVVRMTFSRNKEFGRQSGRDSTRLPLRDSALPYLLAFPELMTLDVSCSLVTDKGLKTIAELKNLKRVDLCDTHITQDGIEGLKKALPSCEILYTHQPNS